MRLRPDQALRVRLRWSPEDHQAVGRLAWRDRRAWFEYDEAFLASGRALSPFHLPLRPGVLEAPRQPFHGLFGAFADSLPDGWGLLLQERRAQLLGPYRAQLTPLDRLAWVGDTGVGALAYQPELVEGSDEGAMDLDHLASESRAVLAGHASEVLPELLRLGGSPHGARPKVLVWLRPDDGQVVASQAPGRGFRPVLVKFHAEVDAADAGAVELAYNHMARESGIDVPRAWLLPSDQGAGWFAVERFDLAGAERVHVHTLCGLLHADHRLPSLDYVGALTAVHRLTRDQRQLERMFRRMVFNVLAHNRDDHTKQTSLCMARDGTWTLSPAYDLTFSRGPGGEHSMAVAGAGHPERGDLFEAAKQVGVVRNTALGIIDEVAAAVARWDQLAVAAGVDAQTIGSIRAIIG